MSERSCRHQIKAVVALLSAVALHAQVISGWAYGGPDHRLHYQIDGRGNSIMDFSSAGYRGGGVMLPSVSTALRMTAAVGDNTARIQEALDKANGAVVLAAGAYQIGGTLRINHSGVVLRGEKGARIQLTGKPHLFLDIGGSGTWQQQGAPEPVLDRYVSAGSTSFRVRNASTFHPGDRVLVVRQLTAEWIQFMGMDIPASGAHPPSWAHPGGEICTDRVVESVDQDVVTLDAPLSDALDAKFMSVSLVHYSFPGRIAEVGVEGLRVVAAFEAVPAHHPPFSALHIDAVEDGFARDLDIEGTESGIETGPAAKRITLTNVHITHASGNVSSVAGPDFALQGTQILADRCRVTGESAWPMIVGETSGPLVALNFSADHGGVATRQGWATGLLVDGGNFPGATERSPGVAFSAPSGQDWGIGWAVAWNVSSPFLLVQQPPGALNWCIGCVGTPVKTGGQPNGIFDSLGTVVVPPSLYLHQLQDRLGPDVARNIGY